MASGNTMKLLLAADVLAESGSDLIDFMKGADMSEEELSVITNDVVPSLRSIGFTEEADEILAAVTDYLGENSK